jgi:dihydrolipoamide dehydrogenase
MKILTNTKFISGVNNKENGVKCIIEDKKGQREMEADVVLVSIGRKAYTAGLQLEKAGLSTVA